MNDKQQLAAMGEHMAEQPICMAKRIEELEAQVRVMAELLLEAVAWMDDHPAMPDSSMMHAALAGKMPTRLPPPRGWAVTVHDTGPRHGHVDISGPGVFLMTMPVSYSMLDFFKALEATEVSAIPEDWKLVPVVATKAMWDAWDSAPNNDEDDSVNMRCAYSAMLAAAPKPEVK